MSLALEWLRPKTGEDPMAYHGEVFRYAMAKLGNREDAEDVAIEVVQALPSPCHKRDLRVYMLGMTRRKAITLLRRRRPVVEVEDRDSAVRFDDRADQAAMVGQVLAGIHEEHREVLTLKYMAGLTSAEIGKITGKRAEAVDSMLQRAREAFAEAWTRLSSDEVKP
ncbi:MAG TPA: sigma-70 family RNA polymerase sigma factor [Fimbriimonadaceae bacterium]|nr:sigma-70 family RNA polymerase sigma factor [Fimbriimonadaceae bacterium]